MSSPRSVSSQYLLGGIIKCGSCGKAMFGMAAKSGQYHYYTCSTRYRSGSSVCSAKAISVSKMDEAVLGVVLEQVLKQDHLARLWVLIGEERIAMRSEAESTAQAITDSIEDIDRRLAKNYEALEDGSLDLVDLAPRIRTLREERERHSLRLVEIRENSRLPVNAPSKDQIANLLGDFRGLLETGTLDERKAVIRGFIKEVRRNERKATIKYTLPELSPPSGRKVLDIDLFGGAGGIRTRYLLLAKCFQSVLKSPRMCVDELPILSLCPLMDADICRHAPPVGVNVGVKQP